MGGVSLMSNLRGRTCYKVLTVQECFFLVIVSISLLPSTKQFLQSGQNITWNETLGCGRPVTPLSPVQRILLGRPASGSSFPWHVLVLTPHRAAGSLISRRWILTAAHTLYPKGLVRRGAERLAEGLTVYAGSGSLGELLASAPLGVAAVTVHPGFGPEPHNFDNDIALLRLRREVRLSGSLSPVCLPQPRGLSSASPPSGPAPGRRAGTGPEPEPGPRVGTGPEPEPGPRVVTEPESEPELRPGTVGLVPGFGMTEEYVMPDALRYAVLPTVSAADCLLSLGPELIAGRRPVLTGNMLCAGPPGGGGADSCLGDTGGGWVTYDPRAGRWRLGGIVSWGLGCGRPGHYGVYTRVSRYLPWIQRVTRASEEESS